MKNSIDDTVALSCNIESSTTAHNVTNYIIRVQRGCVRENTWVVNKRYSDFDALSTVLQQYGAELTMPPKKVFGKLDKEFIAERQQGLQHFLNQVMEEPILASSLIVKQFLCPQDYSGNFQEEALQHVSMMFRSETKYELVEPLQDIGWRIRKQYFLLKQTVSTSSKERYILSRSEHGPHKHLSNKELQSVFKVLPLIQHPHIEPILYSSMNDAGGLVVYKYYDTGTLRDYINKSKVKQSYLKKYYHVKSGGGGQVMCLNKVQIALLGRQLLETLQFLHKKCLYSGGHIHAGNIQVRNGAVHLLDVHNWLQGLSSLYRGMFVQHRRISNIEAVDVYSFGQTLYEMCYGEQLKTSTCHHLLPQTDPEIRSVLEAILSVEACKRGLPTISQLLQHNLFSSISSVSGGGGGDSKPVCKVGSKLKEVLNQCRSQYEDQLQQEQKQLSQWRKFSKAQAYHMSDEEKRRRKLEMRRKSAQELKLQQQAQHDAYSKRHSITTAAVSGSGMASGGGGGVVSDVQEAQKQSTDMNNIGAAPPAPPPPPPAPLPAASAPLPTASAGEGTERAALLGSITGFNKSALRKSVTLDKSAPKI